MNRGAMLLLIGMMFFSVAGCVGLSRTAKPDSGSDIYAAALPTMTQTEQFYLRTWQHSAEMAEEANEFDLAVLYYTKVKDYFPDTKEAAQAEKRLKALGAAEQQPDSDEALFSMPEME
ncbi:MAG: hypothetical protein KJ893_01035 [Candidatus Omnitrophica bacterium]|nr:hypothetical protein [Candidatus Omnitrophota bacterium]MBU4478787.1 hypothetical protein [Candidatus Omnitrophota bacterium]MCG2703676.1 hypothetical protein [Candidatus Omnitrophota bacterium]